jgi:hypothetical protein
MNAMRSVFPIVFCCTALFVHCGKELNSNPFDPDYRGDYRLEVLWDSLPPAPEPFVAYHAPFVSRGEDPFTGFEALEGVDSRVFEELLTDSTFALYFSRFDSLTCRIAGLHHNGTRTVVNKSFAIRNPYRLRPDEAVIGIGETTAVWIERDSGEAPGGLSALWRNSARIASAPLDSSFQIIGTAIESQRVFVDLLDSTGNRASLAPATIVIAGHRPRIDSLWFEGDLILGDTAFLVARVHAGADSLAAIVTANGDTILDEALGVADSTISFAWEPGQTGTVMVACEVAANGLRAAVRDTVEVGSVAPRPRFLFDTLETPIGDTLRIAAPDSTGRAVRWIWRRGKGFLDSAAADSLTVRYDSATIDTIIVTGADRFGRLGPADTLLVFAAAVDYRLVVDQPEYLWAGVGDTLVARVESEQAATPRSIEYLWDIPDALGAASPGGESLFVAATAVNRLEASVIAYIDETDTTTRVRINLPVRRHRPALSLCADSLYTVIDSAISCAAAVTDTNPGGAVARIYRMIGDSVESFAPDSAEWELRFSEPRVYILKAWAVDNDAFVSDTARAVIHVASFAPVVSELTVEDSAFIHQPVTMRLSALKAENGGEISAYLWDFDGDTTDWDTSTAASAIDWTFSDSGEVAVYAACRDVFEKQSAAARFTVHVSAGAPVIEGVSPDQGWRLDTLTIAVHAADNDGGLLTYGVSLDDGAFVDSAPGDSTFTHIFDTDGVMHVRVRATDTHGMTAETLDSILISSGAPVASLDGPETVWAYDTVAVTVQASDPNNEVVMRAIQWSAAAPFASAADSVFTHVFTDSGAVAIRAFVADAYGIVSDTIADTVVVRLGEPRISAVSIDTQADSVFVNDQRTYTIQAADLNDDGRIDSVMASWDGDEIFEQRLAATGDSASFAHAFTADQSGERTVRFRVYDDDGQYADTVWSPRVRLGAPVIDSVSPDRMWVNDDTTFTFAVRDTNGTVDSVIINWNDGTPLDTLVLQGNPGDTSVNHKYPIADDRGYDVAVTLIDDDGVRGYDTLPVWVMRGNPRVVANDTIVHTNNPSVNITVHAAGSDTNGTVEDYSWDVGLGGSWSSTDTVPRISNIIITRKAAVDIAVQVTDDDGNTALDTMNVYVNALPQKTSNHDPAHNTGVGSRTPTLSWTGYDEEDGTDVQYRLWLWRADLVFPAMPIQDWTSESTFTTDTLDANRGYNWRVDTKDSHGGITLGDTLLMFVPNN